MPLRSMAWAAVLLPLAMGCGDPTGTLPQGQPFDSISGLSGSPTMNPGDDCLSCHVAGGLASGRPWTLAGTVYATADAKADAGLALAQILVTDANGKQLTLVSNAAGNFYTAEPLADLVDIEVQNGSHRLVMQTSVVGTGALSLLGSCNSCHQLSSTPGTTLGVNGAPGRLFIPAAEAGTQ